MGGVSVVIPALNEAETLGGVIADVRRGLDAAAWDYEILVVDDGSTDETAAIAREHGAEVISHPIPGGYGLSLRDGIRRARHERIAIIDGDGTYPAESMPELLEGLEVFDMVVGARGGTMSQSPTKWVLRKFFKWICQFVTGTRIPDANSGLRVFRKETVMRFEDTFCMGFSFTTTITLAFHLHGLFVKYVPIPYFERKNPSHVRLFRDTLRTSQIITQAILYYNPIKLYLLLSIGTGLVAVVAFAARWLGLPDPDFFGLVAQSFLIVSCLFFGFGLLAEGLRKR